MVRANHVVVVGTPPCNYRQVNAVVVLFSLFAVAAGRDALLCTPLPTLRAGTRRRAPSIDWSCAAAGTSPVDITRSAIHALYARASAAPSATACSASAAAFRRRWRRSWFLPPPPPPPPPPTALVESFKATGRSGPRSSSAAAPAPSCCSTCCSSLPRPRPTPCVRLPRPSRERIIQKCLGVWKARV